LVGAEESIQPPFVAPMTASFDGSSWTTESPGGFERLSGVTLDANGRAWAAGEVLGDLLMVTRDP
jgi:hypothetical protein